jgi:3-methyladenine DNA glycosylase AlkD
LPGDPEAMAVWAEEALRELADPARREATLGYFPTALEILGVSAPKMRSVLRQLAADLTAEPPGRVLDLTRALLARGTHEGRQVAFELLDRRKDARRLLTPEGIRAMGEANDNWASVDAYCAFVSGPAWREGQLPDAEVLAWARSTSTWWRRAALVSTVPLNMRSRGGRGDSSRTLRICAALAEDRDPMVAKALSWALRALVPVDRASVETFLEEGGEALAPLVRREVRNKLDTGRKNPRRGT